MPGRNGSPERGGLPKVVALEGNARDDVDSEYGQATREIPRKAGRSWSTNVTGQWVSPPPGNALLGEASALSIEGNCTLIVSPYIDGKRPDQADVTNTTFSHVWHGPGTWSCGLERDVPSDQLQSGPGESGSRRRRRVGEGSYHKAYLDCGLCLATGNDNIYAVRLEHLSSLTPLTASKEQPYESSANKAQLREIISRPSLRRRRSDAAVYCPCENDSCGGGRDWAGAVGGVITVLCIVVAAVLCRKNLKKRQQAQQRFPRQQQQHWSHPTPAYPQQQMQVVQPQMQWPQQQMQVQPVAVVQGQVLQASQPMQIVAVQQQQQVKTV